MLVNDAIALTIVWCSMVYAGSWHLGALLHMLVGVLLNNEVEIRVSFLSMLYQCLLEDWQQVAAKRNHQHLFYQSR
ncbi:hypothetical protein [Paracnuella aquatica]|uniref:hypothetical protein n=1 Tax=Paracnuella aquatica TaxID=2268757 RepID=UPI000DEF41F9|nr:hypothetical protein [Paracnuella aquatica]RPD49045.1 hypothetical protein DRJ53_07955 [Paracnuella aquatica]